MRPTRCFLLSQFVHWNDAIFSGDLPVPAFYVTRASRYAGIFRVRRLLTPKGIDEKCSIALSALYDHSEDELIDTLIHEMIHYYFHYKKIRDTAPHGERFRMAVSDINSRFGRNVTLKEKLDDERAYTTLRKKAYVLAVCHMETGRRYVAVLSRSYVRSLYMSLKRIRGVSSVKLFVTTDPRLVRYPQVRTPKLFDMNPDMLDGIIAAAHPLS